MPLLLVGVGFLAFLLLAKREPTPAEKQKLANDIAADAVAKGNAIARQGQAEQGKNLARGLGLAVTGVGTAAGIIKGFLGAGAVAAGGAGAATSTGTGVAVGAGTATAGGAGAGTSTLAVVGTALGTSAAGAVAVIGAAVVCALAVFVAIGLAVASAVESLLDFPMAANLGPQAIARGFNASMKRTFDKTVALMQSKVSPSQWPAFQGHFRNVALLMTLSMHRKLNSLYRAGALANAKDIFVSQQQHEIFWADHGAYIPDFEAFADKFISEIGAGSRASVIKAATDAVGTAKLNEILLKSETAGKFLFLYTATTLQPILGITDETYQVGWINRFCVSNPILQRWPIGAPAPFGIFGVSLASALGALQVGWNKEDLSKLIFETYEIKPENLNLKTGVYLENGLMINLVASAELKTPVIVDTTDPQAAATQTLAYYGVTL